MAWEDAVAELGDIEARLGAVERALGRLDDDTYGRCRRCGVALDAAQLDADPLVEACAEGCARASAE